MVVPCAVHSKLVLGYLVDLKCFDAAKAFVKESNHFNGEKENLLHDLSEEKSPDIDVLGESLIEIIDSYSKFKKVIKMSAPNPYLSALGGLMDKNTFPNIEVPSHHAIPKSHSYSARRDDHFQSNPGNHSEIPNSQSNRTLDGTTEPHCNDISLESSESGNQKAKSIPEVLQNVDSNQTDISNANFNQSETANTDLNQNTSHHEEIEPTFNSNSNQQNDAQQVSEDYQKILEQMNLVSSGQVIIPKLSPVHFDEADRWPVTNESTEYDPHVIRSKEAAERHGVMCKSRSSLFDRGKVVAKVAFRKRSSLTLTECDKRTCTPNKKSNTTRNHIDTSQPHVLNSYELVNQPTKVRKMNLRNYAEKS